MTEVTSGVTSSGLIASPINEVVVDAGGTAVDTTVIAGGTELVHGGGAEQGADVLLGGVLYLDADNNGLGVLSGGTIALGGVLSGLADGLLVGTVTDDGQAQGNLQVAGTLTGGVYTGGGRLVADSGGVVSAVTIENTTYAAAGGTLTHDTVLSYEEIEGGGSAIAETVSSGGRFYVDAGGTGSATVITASGYEEVHGAATETGATVSSGGILYLDADNDGLGVLDGGTIQSGGVLSGLADGLLVGTVTNSGTATGNLQVSGTLTGGTYAGGGRLQVDSGGVVSGVTIENTTYAVAGGILTHDTILAHEEINGGGSAVAETVSSGGNLYIDAGGTGSGTVIAASGYEELHGAATETGATVSNGGILYLDDDNNGLGVLDGGTIQSGGVLSGLADGLLRGTVSLASGGTATGNLQVSGTLTGGTYAGAGRLVADDGGVVSGVAIQNTAYAGSGGTLTHDTILSYEEIEGGGSAVAETVSSGGRLYVDAGGTGSGTVITASGYEEVHGGGVETTATVVGGVLYVDADNDGLGVIDGGTIQSGGVLSGLADGLLRGTVTNYGAAQGNLQVSGTLAGGTYAGGGRLLADGGGVVSGVAIENTAYAGSGGTLTHDTILSHEEIQSGGLALDETVSSGGSLYIDAGGTGSGTTITTGTTEYVHGGAVEIDAAVAAGGILYLDADNNGPGSAVFSGTGVLIENGTISGGGTVTVSGPGTVVLGSGDEYTGGTIISGGTLALGAVAAAGSGAITFAGAGTLRIDTAAAPANVISGFATGDTIDLGAYAYSSAGDSIAISGDTVTVSTPTGTVTLDIAGASTVMPRLAAAADGTLVLEAPCFARGTQLLGPDGEVPVEDLVPGDLLVVREHGRDALRAVRWVGHRRLEPARHPHPERVHPVRIAPGALGHGVPSRPLRVSPDHALLLDGVLIAARQLVNGGSIAVEPVTAVQYFHVELERHGILVADGAEAESYLDTGNRSMFANGGVPASLHADFSRADDPRACAPLVTDAERVRPVWDRLAVRSAVLGYEPWQPATTREPELRLVLADGTELLPEQTAPGGRSMFLLPPGRHADLLLRSRRAAPADTLPWLDDRRSLGVAVSRIRVWTAAATTTPAIVALDAPDRGWWPVESDGDRRWRWTTGDAALSLPDDTVVVEITVSAIPDYLRPEPPAPTATWFVA